jgi:hypothetical protein
LQRLNPVMSNKNKGLLVIWHHIVYDVKENWKNIGVKIWLTAAMGYNKK